MRALLQRVTNASVTVNGQKIASIGKGLAVFLGVGRGDTSEDARYLAEKIAHLRVFPDTQERFNLSTLEARAQLLLVSQFTLYADTRRGRRPSFSDAAPPQEAQPLLEQLQVLLQEQGLLVETGQFGAHMLVELTNDGPVTLWLDSADRLRPRG
jgi:D-tyrosyl-tRNA(Tyr) deacylase